MALHISVTLDSDDDTLGLLVGYIDDIDNHEGTNVTRNGDHEVTATFSGGFQAAEEQIRSLVDGLNVVNLERHLDLSFQGRIIDQLGIQMYQSPVAAVAELVSNSWDADSTWVNIDLPEALDGNAEITISDNGNGMTLEEIQKRFLNVGYDRRDGDPSAKTQRFDRPVLGRKGIGKFAGFGIATVVKVDTLSRETGERTVFEMNRSLIRGDGNEYVGGEAPVEITKYYSENGGSSLSASDPRQEDDQGTIVRLQNLAIKRRPSPSQFPRSMARRFLLNKQVDNFDLKVDGTPIPDSRDLAKVQYSFPQDYKEDEGPENITVDEDGWGTEELQDGNSIKWKFDFFEETINEEDLSGVAVFAEGKLAQKPFLFNQKGGMYGQAGAEYLAGQVQADYLDHFNVDVIATERQRINWALEETSLLEAWGQSRIKQLLRLWNERRREHKEKKLTERLGPFRGRLENLPDYEREIVEGALKKLAGVSRMADERFESIGGAVLTAWEGGRLKNLIRDLGTVDRMTEDKALDILIEARALTALHTAEAVKAKLDTITGLETRIENGELENAIRDYIAENPWLLSPEWETFRVEKSLENLAQAAAEEVKLDSFDDWNKRVDLVLASGSQILIVEFMRPGLKVDDDHLSRFQKYVYAIRGRVESNTGGQYTSVRGMLVADRLEENHVVRQTLKSLRKEGMDALDWPTLLTHAKAQWQEFFDVLAERSDNDPRIDQFKKKSNTDEMVSGEESNSNNSATGSD
jgi:hypothetical protein